MRKRQVLGIVLMLVGVIIISSALYMRYSAERRQKQMVEDFQKSLKGLGNGENSDNPTATGDAAAVDPERPGSVNDKAIAMLEIPKIDITVAVMEGTTDQALRYSVGHFSNTAMPGEKGNFCVAGHRSYTYNEYFNRLNELGKGDIIKVRTLKGEFTYEVTGSEVVEPTQVSVLDPTEDSTITLVTCTPVRVATHRLIIKGKLKQ